MKVEFVLHASVIRGNDEGLSFHNEADVANESFIEDSMDRLGVVSPAGGQSLDLRALCRSELAHAASVSLAHTADKSQSGW